VSETLERSSHDSIRWYPRVTVEKYSIDQTRWAENRLAEYAAAGRRPFVYTPHLGSIPVQELHGDWLRAIFPNGPEDGIAVDEGNLLTNAGLTNLINLLTGATGTAINPLRTGGSSGAAVVGVGSSSTAATTSDTALGGNGSTTTAYYQSMDASYPSLTTPATINGQSTFATGNANFAWNEWCWATGAGTVTAGGTLASVYATAGSVAMLNHKVPAGGLGTKAAGASWVFSTTVTFS
jgi:hypothetical protein